MTLLDFLRERREDIAERWTNRVFQTYPLETTGFLRRSADPFANPVAVRTQRALTALTAALLEAQLDTDQVAEPLDDIIRIRSVQEFTPSQAVAALYFAKAVVREFLEKEKKIETFALELLQFESKVDTLALMAMDIYDQCRNQVSEMRIREVKTRYSQVMRLAKLTCDLSAEGPEDDTRS